MPTDRITVPVGDYRDRDEAEEFARDVLTGNIEGIINVRFVEHNDDEVTLKVSHNDERDADAIEADLGAREVERTAA